MMRLILVAFSVATLFSAVGAAQKVRYIDLTGVEQRQPDTPSNSRFDTFSSCGSQEPFPHQAKVSLEWMDTTDLYPHQRIGLEIRVENVGTVSFKLPVHPNLADLQPKSQSERFEYYRLRLPVAAAFSTRAVGVAWLELFGSFSNPDTFVTLESGEWIRVRGEIVVQRWYRNDRPAIASAGMKLFKYVLPVRKKDSAIPSNVRCILGVNGASIPIQMHAQPRP